LLRLLSGDWKLSVDLTEPRSRGYFQEAAFRRRHFQEATFRRLLSGGYFQEATFRRLLSGGYFQEGCLQMSTSSYFSGRQSFARIGPTAFCHPHLE
jgi:hypothetical protein